MIETKRGRWSIGKDHEVLYTGTEDKKDESLTVRGSLVAAEPEALVVSVTQKQSDQETVTRLVKLAGTWRMDAKNRIVFEVEKEGGRRDVLVFGGSWDVGDSQEIVYTYRATSLKTKKKVDHAIRFKGHWDVDGKNRLEYTLGADSDSSFTVRGAFQTKSILAKTGEIRYQLGAGSSGRSRARTITLFGKWRLSRSLGLSFEMEYARGRKRAILFGGDYHLSRDSTLSVGLSSRDGRPLGIELFLGVKRRW